MSIMTFVQDSSTMTHTDSNSQNTNLDDTVYHHPFVANTPLHTSHMMKLPPLQFGGPFTSPIFTTTSSDDANATAAIPIMTATAGKRSVRKKKSSYDLRDMFQIHAAGLAASQVFAYGLQASRSSQERHHHQHQHQYQQRQHQRNASSATDKSSSSEARGRLY